MYPAAAAVQHNARTLSEPPSTRATVVPPGPPSRQNTSMDRVLWYPGQHKYGAEYSLSSSSKGRRLLLLDVRSCSPHRNVRGGPPRRNPNFPEAPRGSRRNSESCRARVVRVIACSELQISLCSSTCCGRLYELRLRAGARACTFDPWLNTSIKYSSFSSPTLMGVNATAEAAAAAASPSDPYPKKWSRSRGLRAARCSRTPSR